MKKTWGISDLLGVPRNLNMYLVSVTNSITSRTTSGHSIVLGIRLELIHG